MLKLILRITFTIISALFIAAVIPVGAALGWDYAVYCVLGACAFFVLMLICKQAQEKEQENKTENEQLKDEEQAH